MINKRLRNLEKSTNSNFISTVLSRIESFDGDSLLKLLDAVKDEANKRGLLKGTDEHKPDISVLSTVELLQLKAINEKLQEK